MSLDVCLAVMPFGDVVAPAIGVSLLKARLTRTGRASRVRHFTLDFAASIGRSRFNLVGFWNRSLIDERLFAPLVFGTRVPDPERYRAEVQACVVIAGLTAALAVASMAGYPIGWN
jgi:hypothetical protein